MNESLILFGILGGAVLVGLVAIWRELRVISRGVREKYAAGRAILPMSTGVSVLPTQSVQITGRPQDLFRPERIFIGDGHGGSKDWIVNDIKVHNKSVFVQSGDIPGDMFSTNAIDSFVNFPIIESGKDFVIVATYVGKEATGVPLYAAVIGTHVSRKPSRDSKRRKAAIANATVN